MFLIVCPLVFLAGLIDSAAGGGGLISIPAYYAAGLPPYLASGTNKLSSSLGTTWAAIRYFRSGHLNWKVGLLAAAGAVPGSYLGAALQQTFSERQVHLMMLVMIPLAAVFVLTYRSDTANRLQTPARFQAPVCILVGLVIGFYDGLVGPGTGTFLIILFTMFLGLHPVDASGTAKIVNLASNIAALFSYLIQGHVMILLGLPAAIFTILGAQVGSSLAIHRGARFIRHMLLIVLALLLARMLIDVLS